MGLSKASCSVSLLQLFIVVCLVFQCCANKLDADLNTTLIVDASDASRRPIPDTLFGLFFEEINHAGAGGLWAELVSNRGFEAGGLNTPSNIDPWSIIGNQSSINVETDRTSCFDRNKVALRLEVLCDSKGDNICPTDGVGVYNIGFWGMEKFEQKKHELSSQNSMLIPGDDGPDSQPSIDMPSELDIWVESVGKKNGRIFGLGSVNKILIPSSIQPIKISANSEDVDALRSQIHALNESLQRQE